MSSSSKKVPSYTEVRQMVDEKRQIIEQGRTANLRRIQQDIQRIAKREREYGRKLLEELIPVKVTWDEEAWKKLQGFVPVKVEYVQEEKEDDVIEPVVVVEDTKA
jgi:DNA-directed RNA polymerase subunit F